MVVASNTGGADYGAIDSTSLTFVPGGMKVLCATFIIVNDTIVEMEESFAVVIESVSPTPGVIIGARNVTDVFIQDNDSKCFANSMSLYLCFSYSCSDRI